MIKTKDFNLSQTQVIALKILKIDRQKEFFSLYTAMRCVTEAVQDQYARDCVF
jgi:hypothetical protein